MIARLTGIARCVGRSRSYLLDSALSVHYYCDVLMRGMTKPAEAGTADLIGSQTVKG